MIYNHGINDITDNYFKLALAVQKLAAVDYVNALRYIAVHKDDTDINAKAKVRRARAEKRDIERSFRGSLFGATTDFNADEFIARLKKIAAKDTKQIQYRQSRDNLEVGLM